MPATPTPGRVVLAYFSRAGENYHYGGRRDLDVGNTEGLAQMIAELTEVDVHRIDAADPYPDDYDATVARNVTEQKDNARPGMANPLASIEAVRHGAAGQPDLERAGADDHDRRSPTPTTSPRRPCCRSSPTPSPASAASHAITPPPAGARIARVWLCGEEVARHRRRSKNWLPRTGLHDRVRNHNDRLTAPPGHVAASERDTMEVEARQPSGKGPAERFTGDVWVDPVAQPRPLPHRMTAALVRFAPGSRTAWHVHALGQTLRITDGIALVKPAAATLWPCTRARPSTRPRANGTGTEPPRTPS